MPKHKKVVIISGGSQGLGREIAQTLNPIYQIVILSPTKDRVEKTAKQIGCDFRVCDISDWDSVETATKSILKRYARIDCLINNASLYIEQELDLDDPAQIKRVNDVNITGTQFLTKAVIPAMKIQKIGLIINIDSQAGLVGQNGKSIYNASKAAIHNFTKSLQIELPKYGIQVTGVYPGKLDTNMFTNMGIKKDMTNALHPKHVARLVEFILSFDNQVVFPEVGVKHPNN